MPLSRDRPVQTAPDLKIEFRCDGTMEIRRENGNHFVGGGHALAVIAAFRRPRTLEQALKSLSSEASNFSDREEWAHTARAMAEAGILAEPDTIWREARTIGGSPSFDSAPVHIRMLDDHVRTRAWQSAIAQTVRPGDVVVEVGTGTGVLAIAAARAGARHVYAIEASSMAAVAREVIRVNGLADTITVIEGWSTSVTLPERGDVLVSETIGNAAFDEALVPIVRDALHRHLKPGARTIPKDLTLFGLPVEAPTAWLDRLRFHARHAATWGEWYGFDFGPLAELPAEYLSPTKLLYPPGSHWPAIAEPLRLASAVFSDPVEVRASGVNTFAATRAGELNAFAIYFMSTLADGIVLSSDPRQPREVFPTSWPNPVWLVPPLKLDVGARATLDFAWNERPPNRWNLSTA